jgi:hypothetical protein
MLRGRPLELRSVDPGDEARWGARSPARLRNSRNFLSPALGIAAAQATDRP